MQNCLMVGCGDIARRVLPGLLGRYRVHALLRDATQAAAWRSAGARPLIGDLDHPESLRRLAGIAQLVLHFAPPPGTGRSDPRTRRLLAALRQGGSLPRTLIYISTTGVYGNCQGERIDETRRCAPQSDRARRRLDAERHLRDFACRSSVRVCLLRAPGIYAADRLPVSRLQSGLPVLLPEEDSYSNHIHADDLAGAVLAAIRRGRSNRVVNVVDHSALAMGDYFDRVADTLGLPRPARVSRAAATTQLSALQRSFLDESRRIVNRRLVQELAYRLRYPTVDDLLATLKKKDSPC